MATAFFTYTVPQKLSVRKQLLYLKGNFTNPGFNTLCSIVRGCLKRQGRSTLSNMANDTGKCISSISYFFNAAAWRIADVRDATRNHCLRSPLTKIEEGDIAAVDESSISKQGDSFQFIGRTWDNADKEVHTGFTFIGLAIVSTRKNVRWLFDEIVYSNNDPTFRGVPVYLLRLLKRLFAQTSIGTVVFDAGFKYQYVFKYILEQSRHFIVRATASMVVHTTDKQYRTQLPLIRDLPGSETRAFSMNGTRGWSVSWCSGYVNAWLRVIKVPLTVVVIRRPSFKNPMVLITSRTVTSVEDATAVYRDYLNRWKIEILYQEIKMLGLESFRVRRKVAILKYITITVLLHLFITVQTTWIHQHDALREVIVMFLRRTRKITCLCFGGTKILYESLLSGLHFPDVLGTRAPTLAVDQKLV